MTTLFTSGGNVYNPITYETIEDMEEVEGIPYIGAPVYCVENNTPYYFTNVIDTKNINAISLNSGEGSWLPVDTDYIYVTGGAIYSTLNISLPNTNFLIGNSNGIANNNPITGDITVGNTGIATISNGVVTGAKMAALPGGEILVGNPSNVATAVSMSGDGTLSTTGSLTIADGAITGAKMVNMGSGGNLFIASGTGVATALPMSGAVNMNSGGVTTLTSNSVATSNLSSICVTNTKMADDSVDTPQLVTGCVTIDQLDSSIQYTYFVAATASYTDQVFATTTSAVGPTQTLSTDFVYVQLLNTEESGAFIINAYANSGYVTLIWNTVPFSASINVLVFRASPSTNILKDNTEFYSKKEVKEMMKNMKREIMKELIAN